MNLYLNLIKINKNKINKKFNHISVSHTSNDARVVAIDRGQGIARGIRQRPQLHCAITRGCRLRMRNRAKLIESCNPIGGRAYQKFAIQWRPGNGVNSVRVIRERAQWLLLVTNVPDSEKRLNSTKSISFPQFNSRTKHGRLHLHQRWQTRKAQRDSIECREWCQCATDGTRWRSWSWNRRTCANRPTQSTSQSRRKENAESLDS